MKHCAMVIDKRLGCSGAETYCARESPRIPCDHGLVFDEAEAGRILGSWEPRTAVEFIMGNPKHAEVRKRFPRLDGECPKGCGYVGIAYVSGNHFVAGDW